MRRGRSWPRRLSVAAALLLALHGAAWLATIWRLEAELDARRAELVAQGWRVSSGPARWAGWPLAARLDLDNPTLLSPDGAAGWRSAGARFGIQLVRPLWLTTALDGPHVLTVAGIDVPVRTERLTVSGRLLGQPQRTELALRGLRAEGPGGTLAIGGLDLHATTDPLAAPGRIAAIIAATASDLELPSPVMARAPGGFGARIPSLALDGNITAPLPPGPPTRPAAEAWRAANGRLTLDRIAVRWGRLDVTGNAELQLDPQLQPTGQGTLRALGVPETADALAGAGAIPNGTARAVKALAALMARPPDNEVELTLSLVDRTIVLAGFPIAKLPELRW